MFKLCPSGVAGTRIGGLVIHCGEACLPRIKVSGEGPDEMEIRGIAHDKCFGSFYHSRGYKVPPSAKAPSDPEPLNQTLAGCPVRGPVAVARPSRSRRRTALMRSGSAERLKRVERRGPAGAAARVAACRFASQASHLLFLSVLGPWSWFGADGSASLCWELDVVLDGTLAWDADLARCTPVGDWIGMSAGHRVSLI